MSSLSWWMVADSSGRVNSQQVSSGLHSSSALHLQPTDGVCKGRPDCPTVLCCVLLQSVVRKQSSLQSDGSVASSVYSAVAESPIPLVDDLLSQPVSAQPGGSRLRVGQRGPSAATAQPLPSRPSRAGVAYGAGDVGDEVDIPSVTDELDLLSLASQPNVYLVPAATQHGRSVDIDILTGTPPVSAQLQSLRSTAAKATATATAHYC